MKPSHNKFVTAGLAICVVAIFAFFSTSLISFIQGNKETQITQKTNDELTAQVLQQDNDVQVHYYNVETPQELELGFVTTWKTDNTSPGSSAANQITIPTTGDGYNYAVDWGDGNASSAVTGNITHTYSTPGTYTVSITGSFPRIYINNSGDRLKLVGINQWGSIAWTSMAKAFYGANNASMLAPDAPDLSNVTDMSFMFAFNQATWNSSIGSWDTSHVTNMAGLFSRASTFNKNISSWNVSNVTDMNSMFYLATSFNQPLNTWNVGRVTNMNGMFLQASAFNQPLGSWNVSNVTDMGNLFYLASAFSQPLHTWNIRNVTDMHSMLGGTVPLSTANYDALLTAWAALPVRQNVVFGAGTNKYTCASNTQRNLLLNTYHWTITDGGVSGTACPGAVTDTTRPSLSSASVNKTTLTLTYNENLDQNSEPAKSAFAVKKSDNTTVTVSSVRVSGSSVIITLSSNPGPGGALKITYTVPASNPIQDLAGNDATALASQSVTNNTPTTNTTSTSNSNNSSRTNTYSYTSTSNTQTTNTQTTSQQSINTSGMSTTQLLELIRALQIQLSNIIAQKSGGSQTQTPVATVVTTPTATAPRTSTYVTSSTLSRDLKLGDTGNDVITLQKYLIYKGYLNIAPSAAQGNFGPLTQAALARFQKDTNISPASGIMGPITRTFIRNHP